MLRIGGRSRSSLNSQFALVFSCNRCSSLSNRASYFVSWSGFSRETYQYCVCVTVCVERDADRERERSVLRSWLPQQSEIRRAGWQV